MNFTICLTVPMKMSKETVLSVLINIIHIIPMCPDSLTSLIRLQNLRMLSLLNLLVILIKPIAKHNEKRIINLFLRLSLICL